MRKQSRATVSAELPATDSSKVTLNRLQSSEKNTWAFLPSGFTSLSPSAAPSLLFKGEKLEFSGIYLLGEGYHRPYNPQLMRFHSPDTLSPFGAGGVHAYAYCAGDPINNVDPTGHYPVRMKRSISISTFPLDSDTITHILANQKSVEVTRAMMDVVVPGKAHYQKIDIFGMVEKALDSKRPSAITTHLQERLSVRQGANASNLVDSYPKTYEKALEQEAKARIFLSQHSSTTPSSNAKYGKLAIEATTSMQQALSQRERLKHVKNRIRRDG
ncbi:RHS repeat-associated core domain-containing protein [Pseudomonas sp. NPDC089547]|uniref:RHS repeat-associated core domain-containing protein n=1 Tax=Pseudomonas sp. NPDC089547 TaxID=3390652 RepID=UPI003D06CFDF